MITWLRSALFSIVYIPSTIFYGTATQLVRWLPPSILPPARLHRFVISWCRLNVEWLRIIVGARYQVSGLEHLQNVQGPVMVLAKHQKHLGDAVITADIFPRYYGAETGAAVDSVFRLGPARFAAHRHRPGQPGMPLKLVKERGLEQLAAGNNMLLFPEGTRTPLGSAVNTPAAAPISPSAQACPSFRWPSIPASAGRRSSCANIRA